MIVAVAGAIAEILHQLRRRVENVRGRRKAAGVARRGPRRLLRGIGGVRFGRGRAIEARLHDRQLALGRSEELEGILRGKALDERLRVGEPDVLTREAGDAAQHVERRSEEHTSELQSLMRISYAVFCLKKKNNTTIQ